MKTATPVLTLVIQQFNINNINPLEVLLRKARQDYKENIQVLYEFPSHFKKDIPENINVMH
jgi:hypothetical protein